MEKLNRNERLFMICSEDRVDMPNKEADGVAGYLVVSLVALFIGFIFCALAISII